MNRYSVRLGLPLLGVHIRSNSSFIFIIVLILNVAGLTGYILNFQNIWQYFPDTSTINTIGDIANINIRFFISIVGVLFAPLGTVTGFIW